ncbi:hypothetical protein Bra3105_15075 [Brachybacterium halotolerans subsp. kimchii]|uniref:hypothetical protein n=1 Tax=Brachybacterium halotolerans TaxID=2795215 RepID=UPI001E5910E3|nr:hypothetical protein [Brachybacterium halotolerans]UEJ82147.1 hypothetical protein Bra3105_15075 [Brachybacterium halotolerans subsp. kimchii]
MVRLRGWLSWVLALWAGSRWFDDYDDWSGWFEGMLASAVETAVVIPVLLLLGFVVLPLIAVRGERRAIYRAMLEPGRTLVISAILVVGIIFAADLSPRLAVAPSSSVQSTGDAVGLLLGIVMLTLLLAVMWFMSAWTVWGIPAVLRHMFRVHDAHPAYPAVLTLALCIYSLGIGLVRDISGGWESPFPFWAQILFLIGGPCGIAATSVAELIVLRKRHDVSLRRAYWSQEK